MTERQPGADAKADACGHRGAALPRKSLSATRPRVKKHACSGSRSVRWHGSIMLTRTWAGQSDRCKPFTEVLDETLRRVRLIPGLP